jgi:hypothetical protein
VGILQCEGFNDRAIWQFTVHCSVNICAGLSENRGGSQNADMGAGQDANEKTQNDDSDSENSGLIADHD